MKTLLPIVRRDSLFNWPERSIFERFFDDLTVPAFLNDEKEWMPNVDVSETDKEIVVKAEVPGMNKDDIEVTLTEGLLTIRGEKKHEHEEKKEHYKLVESHYGSFSRTLRLPSEIEADKIDANYKNGVLKLTIPKAEKAGAKKLEIKS